MTKLVGSKLFGELVLTPLDKIDFEIFLDFMASSIIFRLSADSNILA